MGQHLRRLGEVSHAAKWYKAVLHFIHDRCQHGEHQFIQFSDETIGEASYSHFDEDFSIIASETPNTATSPHLSPVHHPLPVSRAGSKESSSSYTIQSPTSTSQPSRDEIDLMDFDANAPIETVVEDAPLFDTRDEVIASMQSNIVEDQFMSELWLLSITARLGLAQCRVALSTSGAMPSKSDVALIRSLFESCIINCIILFKHDMSQGYDHIVAMGDSFDTHSPWPNEDILSEVTQLNIDGPQTPTLQQHRDFYAMACFEYAVWIAHSTGLLDGTYGACQIEPRHLAQVLIAVTLVSQRLFTENKLDVTQHITFCKHLQSKYPATGLAKVSAAPLKRVSGAPAAQTSPRLLTAPQPQNKYAIPTADDTASQDTRSNVVSDTQAAPRLTRYDLGLVDALMSVAKMVPDALSPNCTQCHREFGFFVRRHHCKMCGRVFCDTCAPLRVLDPKIKIRACEGCIRKVAQ